jgi:hypothetical protein
VLALAMGTLNAEIFFNLYEILIKMVWLRMQEAMPVSFADFER